MFLILIREMTRNVKKEMAEKRRKAAEEALRKRWEKEKRGKNFSL